MKKIPDIERLKRTIKEMVRVTYNKLNLHINKISIVLIRIMVYAVVFWIKRLPDVDGISDTISLWYVLTGMNPHFSRHCLI